MAISTLHTPSDIGDYPAPHVAVDLVLLTICQGTLRVVMTERKKEPFAGQHVLPGAFVQPDETLDDAAERVLRDKAGLDNVAVEQLYTFSAPGRDPRIWSLSVAYFALMPCDPLSKAIQPLGSPKLITIQPLDVHDVTLALGDEPIEVGFDHQAIITLAVERLRGKLDWSMVAFGLLGEEFTLFELQRVHEVILGRSVNKPHFRKKMLGLTFPDGRRLAPTGRFSRAGRHRPAELYSLKAGKAK